MATGADELLSQASRPAAMPTITPSITASPISKTLTSMERPISSPSDAKARPVWRARVQDPQSGLANFPKPRGVLTLSPCLGHNQVVPTRNSSERWHREGSRSRQHSWNGGVPRVTCLGTYVRGLAGAPALDLHPWLDFTTMSKAWHCEQAKDDRPMRPFWRFSWQGYCSHEIFHA